MNHHHPLALYQLALVELFERLASGAMLPLFALYIARHLNGSESFSFTLSSGFVAASYLASLPGGLFADRFGPWSALVFGSLCLALGFGILAANQRIFFWPALGLLLIGHGLFKPSITTLVGTIYPDDHSRRESGFSLFYVAVNLGSLGGPLLAEWARAHWGWPSIFFCGAGAMGVALLFLPMTPISHQAIFPRKLAPALSLGAERARVAALWLLCGIGVIFYLAFQQTGTTLALFAERHTNLQFGWGLEFRPGHFAALHAALVILFTPLLQWVTARLRARQIESSPARKMIWGFLLTAAAFAVVSAGSLSGEAQRVSPLWLVGCYVLLSLGELFLAPMSLALLTELAPPRLSGRFTGIWYASVAVGHGLAAALGPAWSCWPQHRYFAGIAGLSLIGAAALYLRLGTLETALSRG